MTPTDYALLVRTIKDAAIGIVFAVLAALIIYKVICSVFFEE